jgi:HD superfamily phosphohydrolase YqeK
MRTTTSPTLVVGVLREAAAGRLPPWAVVGPARHEHIARVAVLLDEWADELDLDEAERCRWRAAAWLHDALRDAPVAALRPLLAAPLRDLPDPLVHGPAVAQRLAQQGVDDDALLTAIAYHPLGHPRLDALGRMLYLADYLEPGRTFLVVERAAQRARMPAAAADILVEVVRARLTHLLMRGGSIRPETLEFWNTIVNEQAAVARED